MENSANLHQSKNPPGFYMGVRVDRQSRKQILEFLQSIPICLKNSSSSYERRMHSTIFYAKNQVEVFNCEAVDFVAKPVGWMILRSENTSENCLALQLHCPKMEDFHRKLAKKFNIQHNFEHYTPHISLHYKYHGEIPEKLPEFEIKLKEIYVKPLYFIDKKIIIEPLNLALEVT